MEPLNDQPYRIMLIEDSRTQAIGMKCLLADQGWDVLWTPTGEEAIDRMGGFAPDLLLIDYHLPGMLGDEVCRQVRMRIDTRVMAVIMLTADDDKEVEARGLEAGADDFLRKSEDHETLLLRVRTLLKRARANPSILSPSDTYLRRARLLAVDDSPTYLAHLRSELRNEGYHIEVVPNAEQAMACIDRGNIDCVLVDMIMPGTDGIQFCEQLERWRCASRNQVMIVMLTANEDRKGLAAALEAGADDFVGKSSDITVLKVRIRAALRRKFYIEENHRIQAELRDKQLQIERTRMEKEAAEARAGLVDQLEKTAAALYRSNQELQRFTYIGHHHLQEPLRRVASFSQLLESRFKGKLNPDADSYIVAIISGVKRIKHLIRDLLAYSELSQPQELPARAPVDIDKLVRTVIHDELGESIREAEASVECASLPTVLAAPSQMRYLFRQLIENAIKYRSNRPLQIKITVDSCNSSPLSSTTGLVWLFRIEDNGMGFDPKYTDRVFDIFERLDPHTSEQGTGMGLAVCRRIAENHGGSLSAESQIGQGTVFILALPQLPDAHHLEKNLKLTDGVQV